MEDIYDTINTINTDNIEKNNDKNKSNKSQSSKNKSSKNKSSIKKRIQITFLNHTIIFVIKKENMMNVIL